MTTSAAAARPDTGDDPDEPVDLALQRGALRLDRAQRGADPAELGAAARLLHQRDPVTLHHQGAGEDPRGRVPARPAHARAAVGVGGGLADRDGLAGERRLVDREVHAVQQRGVGRHPVALGEQDDVAAHDVAPGDAYLPAVADDERTRRGEIAERGERVLGLVLLVDRDRDHHDDERHQDGAVERLGEQEVDGSRAEQQEQHRLAHDVPRLLQQVALLRGGQLVRPVGGQAPSRLLRGQAGEHHDPGPPSRRVPAPAETRLPPWTASMPGTSWRAVPVTSCWSPTR